MTLNRFLKLILPKTKMRNAASWLFTVCMTTEHENKHQWQPLIQCRRQLTKNLQKRITEKYFISSINVVRLLAPRTPHNTSPGALPSASHAWIQGTHTQCVAPSANVMLCNSDLYNVTHDRPGNPWPSHHPIPIFPISVASCPSCLCLQALPRYLRFVCHPKIKNLHQDFIVIAFWNHETVTL